MRQKQGVFSLFLLSPSSRRATRTAENGSAVNGISIHALREEGDDGRWP